MHAEAWAFLSRELAPFVDSDVRVVEFGSRNVNGTTRDLFNRATYVGLDIEPGDGVDIVADAADWEPGPYDDADIVICAEVFEHTPRWPKICDTAFHALRPGGLVVLTAASNPRGEHSAVDGWGLREGEFYENIQPSMLAECLDFIGFTEVRVETHPRGDVYATAVRP